MQAIYMVFVLAWSIFENKTTGTYPHIRSSLYRIYRPLKNVTCVCVNLHNVMTCFLRLFNMQHNIHNYILLIYIK